MAFQIGTVNNSGPLGFAHKQFLETVRRLALGYGTNAAPTYSGTGNGTMTGIDTFPATVTETWTITCTAAAANGGTFSVTGSVSGAQAAATVGTPYDNGKIKFTINDGTTDFVVSDQFTLNTTVGALPSVQRWTQMRYSTSDPTSHELILRGPGMAGTEQIFVGIRTYENVAADYYNLAVAGFTGYVSANTWATQPGFRESGVPAHNQSIDYWLVVNGQRVAFGLKVGTPVYESAYVGKILPYASPAQYPYPLAVIGMLSGAAATRYSDTAHTMGYKGNRVNYALRWMDGTYKQPLSYPWNNANIAGTAPAQDNMALRDTGNQYPILSVVMCEATPNVFGELDGIGYVSNFNNTVESVVQVGGTPVVDNPAWTAEQRATAIIAAGGVPHVCLQDVARTSFTDYFTMRLD